MSTLLTSGLTYAFITGTGGVTRRTLTTGNCEVMPMAIEYSISPDQERAIDDALERLWTAALDARRSLAEEATTEGYLNKQRHHFTLAKKAIIETLIGGGRIGTDCSRNFDLLAEDVRVLMLETWNRHASQSCDRQLENPKDKLP